MPFLTRQAILSSFDLTFGAETVEIPEWGGSALVRVLSCVERTEYEQAAEADRKNLVLALVALTLCDGEGKPIFGLDEVSALAEKSAKVVMRLFKVAAKLNRLEEQDAEAAAKN